jgi:hypothetical protein
MAAWKFSLVFTMPLTLQLWTSNYRCAFAMPAGKGSGTPGWAGLEPLRGNSDQHPIINGDSKVIYRP